MNLPVTPESLSDAQKNLVQKNLGLIAVHLKRRLPHERSRPDGPDRWDDLFQDGCLGLMRAARTFDPERGVPFAAYALSRIHQAISGSVRRRDSSVRVPERHGRRPDAKARRRSSRKQDPAGPPQRVPKVFSYSPQAMDGLPARVASPADSAMAWSGPRYVPDAGRSVGELLHRKIRAAAEAALSQLPGRSNGGGDRPALARRILEERLLVADETARTSLRDIAQSSGSSYGRVVKCEALLMAGARRLLQEEDETRELCELSAASPTAAGALVDAGIITRLCEAAAAQARRIFDAAPREQRAAMLLGIVERLGMDLAPLFRRHTEGLDSAERTLWLAQNLDSTSPSGR